MSINQLPEIAALHQTDSLVRIPPSQDVPLSPRVRRILDTSAMRRLASISQLGLVSYVYPGATHSRLEHSLGVYHNALRVLTRLEGDPACRSIVDPRAAEAFLLAALLHDLGHWPFCHPIEDMSLPTLGKHESRVGPWLRSGELACCIDQDWQCEPDDVLSLLDPSLAKNPLDPGYAFLASCLSGPIDVDKLDYLQRDSLHAGVPYGRNFDVGRLINSMCVNPKTGMLAISEKGRTAAEMMVFARYVMFSEVYWHHSVRSATAMLQRCVFLLQNRIDLESSLRLVDSNWVDELCRTAEGSVTEPLADGLFGHRRRLYKRVAEFNVIDGLDVHARLARKPYWWLVACAEELSSQLSRLGVVMHAADILIDAPPTKLEVDINIDVVGRDGSLRTLGDVSPVAAVLAKQQFDNHVKRVRIFVRDSLRDEILERISPAKLESALMSAIDKVEDSSA